MLQPRFAHQNDSRKIEYYADGLFSFVAIPVHPSVHHFQKYDHHFNRLWRSFMVWRTRYWSHSRLLRVDGE